MVDVLYNDVFSEEIEEWFASNVNGYQLYLTSTKNRLNRVLTTSGWFVSSLQLIASSSVPRKLEKEFETCETFKFEGINEWDKASQVLSDLLNKYQQLTVKSRKIRREIRSKDFTCTEEKIIHIVELNDIKYGFMGTFSELKDVVDYLSKLMPTHRFVSLPKRIWNLSNRVTGILSPEVVAHVFSFFVKEFLNGNNPRVKLEEKVLPEINLFDDPSYKWSPSFSVFDDEGVKTERKELIGDGFVTNYLGTIFSKYGKPGNARGYLPLPDYFTLVLNGGDWKLDELIEDTKEGVLVNGVKRTELVDGSVRIMPKVVKTLKGEEIKVREIAIPFQELLSLNGATKDLLSTIVDESHGAVVPYIRIPIRLMMY
ncbi:MAG: metallopeptidase TldD-related protein [Sulfolobaceae archaeon]|nr:metallopeptidase TldD-related protein [Sulfolobaceae archaeon]